MSIQRFNTRRRAGQRLNDYAYGYKGDGQMSTLPPLPFGASVTRLDEGVFADPRHSYATSALPNPPPPIDVSVQQAPPLPPQPVAVVSEPHRQIHTMMVNIILQPNIPQILLAGNTARIGMQIQNSDPANTVFYAFGVQAAANFGFVLPANAIALYDSVTPNDVVWGITTAASSVVVTIAEFSVTYL